MIISRGRRYVFVHIPKTGGSSMALALEARAMRDDILLGDTPKALKRRHRVKALHSKGRLWKHATLADIEGVVTQDELADLFTFTLVRNPWDRMVSYYHWLRVQSFEHSAVALAKAVDFAAFLRDPGTQAVQRAWPAARYMTDARGAERCSLYIRLEHFAQDVVPLQAHLGFDLQLAHLNKSARGQGYSEYYTDETREIVQTCCAPDIMRFGYTFQESTS